MITVFNDRTSSTKDTMNDITPNYKDRSRIETENHAHCFRIGLQRRAGFHKKMNMLISCYSCSAAAAQLQFWTTPYEQFYLCLICNTNDRVCHGCRRSNHSRFAPCGLRGCNNSHASFLGRLSYKATKPALVSVLYPRMRYTVLLFIRAPFYVSLVFVAMCSVFWLFWLSYQYLSSDWLERLLSGSLIVARGSSPESPGQRERMIFVVYCIASLFYYVFVLSPAPTWHILLLLWLDIANLCWKCR